MAAPGRNIESAGRNRRAITGTGGLQLLCDGVCFALQSYEIARADKPAMQFKQALTEISALRLQMARNTEFRGFGPATLAMTSGLAIAASLVQSRWLPDPASRINFYLGLWSGAAVLSVVLIAVEAIRRSREAHQGLAD